MAEDVLRDYYNGKPYKVLAQDIMDKIGVNPIGGSQTNSTLISLIEVHRSLLQDFYNEIGIGYQGNAKRERVNTAEVGMMRGCLDISIWNMKKNLEDGFERVNELFGTSIGVELNDEVFYDGSGNATMGIEEEPIEEDTGSAAVDNENSGEEVDEKNTEEAVEDYEENGEEGTAEDKKSEDDTKEGEE